MFEQSLKMLPADRCGILLVIWWLRSYPLLHKPYYDRSKWDDQLWTTVVLNVHRAGLLLLYSWEVGAEELNKIFGNYWRLWDMGQMGHSVSLIACGQRKLATEKFNWIKSSARCEVCCCCWLWTLCNLNPLECQMSDDRPNIDFIMS